MKQKTFNGSELLENLAKLLKVRRSKHFMDRIGRIKINLKNLNRSTGIGIVRIDFALSKTGYYEIWEGV